MSRIWFSQPLETVATWWRVARRDGVTLGFTTHDRDLWFDGLLHRTAPGMVPSAIRRSADLEPDSAEVEGALSHGAIRAEDLAAGRYDRAQVAIGLVDWESLERIVVYGGTIGSVSSESGAFSADLVSRKAELHRDSIPRTSPTCRAAFCGPGCNLSTARFTALDRIAAFDPDRNAVTLAVRGADPLLAGGTLRWLDGELAGTSVELLGAESGWLHAAQPIDRPPVAGHRVLVRAGCDKLLETCATRFANAINFRGEPFLPGNDQLTRYPSAS